MKLSDFPLANILANVLLVTIASGKRIFLAASLALVTMEGFAQTDCYVYYTVQNNYSGQLAMVRGVFIPENPSVAAGEFRFYLNGSSTPSIRNVGHDYGGWQDPYGWTVEFLMQPGTTFYVIFHNLNTGCETNSGTTVIPDGSSNNCPPAINFTQTYARVCGDNILRVQMQAISSGVSFELRKDLGGGNYHGYGWTTGYMEDPDFTPGQAHLFYVMASVGSGSCITTMRHNITDLDIQASNNAPGVTGDNTVCYGLGTTLDASSGSTGGGYVYKWYNATGNLEVQSNQLQIPPNRPLGTYNYSVERISPGGCITPRTYVPVTVAPRPVVGTIAASKTSILLGESVQITSSGGVGTPVYRASSNGGSSWNVFNNGHAGKYSFSFTPPDLGTYRIQLRNQTDCGFCEDSFQNCPANPYVEIKVDPPLCTVNDIFNIEPVRNGSNPCYTQPTDVKAFFPFDGQTTFDGEFRWYLNDEVDYYADPAGNDYWDESCGGICSTYGPLTPGNSVRVLYFDAIHKCVTHPTTYTMPTITPPSFNFIQEYARVCGDNVLKIQMKAISPSGISFELRKDLGGGNYQSYGSSGSGYLEDPDFTPAHAHLYYVIASVTFPCGVATIRHEVTGIDYQAGNSPPSVAGEKNICFGIGTTLTANDGTGSSYRWYDALNNVISETNKLQIPTSKPVGTYLYTVERISPGGCITPRGEVPVVIAPLAVDGVITTSASVIRLGQTVEITGTGGTGTPVYSASTNGGTTWIVFDNAYVGLDNFFFKPSAEGVYRVQLKNQNNCGFCTGCIHPFVDITVTPDYNFIKEYTMQVSGVSEQTIVNRPIGEKSLTTNFFDGLGRPMQRVDWQSSPLRNDIVQPILYDEVGREAVKYLPYVPLDKDGWFKKNSVVNNNSYLGSAHHQFYSNGENDKIEDDAAPYAKTIFEESPLNRIIKQGAPGVAWQPHPTDHSYDGTDHSIKKAYETNQLQEVVLFKYDMTQEKVLLETDINKKYYATNTLRVNKTRDEEHHEVIEYTDTRGRTVCKKVQYATEGTGSDIKKLYAETYYLYDDFGNLVVVLPPEATKELKKLYNMN